MFKAVPLAKLGILLVVLQQLLEVVVMLVMSI